MKIKALIRIIIWTVISILLASIFALALAGQLTNLTRRLGIMKYDDTNFTAGSGTIADYGAITGINIEWVGGTVIISKNTAEDEIEIRESAAKQLEEWQNMRYKVENGVLYIKYTAPKNYEIWKTCPSKQLNLKIPPSLIGHLEKVDISSTSANVSMTAVSADSITVDSVSGKTQLDRCRADSLDLKSVSGNIIVRLPSNHNGFELDFSTVAGKLNTSLEMKNLSENSYRFKNGECKITVSSEMGSFEIKE
ncbi:MAG: DUF4097 family beta strand repeat protein [Clostridia bacterium]|nr:DUF4097 family beta strand repeat protein [Clostridia bacterium]